MSDLLNDDAALAAFCNRASEAQALALDTEFMRERTYYPELCLIQAAVPGEIVLIDALASLDWTPLAALMGAGKDKILHACRQDQEVLLAALGVSPQPLFDTQHAAALCGFAPQASYASLVSTLCDVELSKGATRTDWSRRPLSAAQLEYAADDVRHLHALREQLQQRLDELGRCDWFAEDMQALALPPADPEPLEVWRRIKGAGALTGSALAVLRELAAWRERRAVARNRPRRWILADELLLSIAERQPQSSAQLQSLGVPEKLCRHQGEALLAAIQAGLDAPPLALDQRIPDKAQIKRLQKALRACAESLSLDPSLLATRADLNALALDAHAPRLATGWRAEVVLPALKDSL